MKMIFLILCVTTLSAFGQEQKNKDSDAKKPLVHITDWNGFSLFFFDDFFDGKEKEILNQVSQEEFQEIKKYCTNDTWPKEIQYDSKYVRDTSGRMEYRKRLNQLNMHKIATFKHIYQGKDWGNYVIIRVPYEENKNWNPNVHWENNVYFIATESSVKDQGN